MSYIVEWVEAYEQEAGRKPSEQVIRILEHVDKISTVVEDLGRRHAREGREALPGDYFRDLVHQAFSGDPDSEFIEEVGSLWQECYMESYQSTPPGINTMEGWNAAANRINRRSFVSAFGREPENDAELDAWVMEMCA